MPWRNGGGITYEVGRWPDGGEFDWRISIAEVAASGAFSAFPGIDRVIMLVDGIDMVLDVDGQRHALQPLEPFAFDGGAETDCTITDPTRDLNVMTRRGRVTAEVDVVRVNDDTPVPVDPTGTLVLVVVAGTVSVTTETDPEADLALLDAAYGDGSPLAVWGSGAVAVIRIRRD